jgi:hypothetical protein
MQLSLLVNNLMAAIPEPAVKIPRHNPKPAGVVRPGSASAMVLEFLGSVPGFRTKSQITLGVNRARKGAGLPPVSIKAIDWALIFLKGQKRIEAVADGARNSRYLRYRIAKPKEENQDGK